VIEKFTGWHVCWLASLIRKMY